MSNHTPEDVAALVDAVEVHLKHANHDPMNADIDDIRCALARLEKPKEPTLVEEVTEFLRDARLPCTQEWEKWWDRLRAALEREKAKEEEDPSRSHLLDVIRTLLDDNDKRFPHRLPVYSWDAARGALEREKARSQKGDEPTPNCDPSPDCDPAPTSSVEHRGKTYRVGGDLPHNVIQEEPKPKRVGVREAAARWLKGTTRSNLSPEAKAVYDALNDEPDPWELVGKLTTARFEDAEAREARRLWEVWGQ